MSEENIKRKIDALLKELQAKTGVSDEEMDDCQTIMELADLSQEQGYYMYESECLKV